MMAEQEQIQAPTFQYSVKIERTAKRARWTLHCYANDKHTALGESVRMYDDIAEVRSPRPDSGTSGAEIGDMATASKTKDNRSKRHQVKLQTVQEVEPPQKIIVDVDVWEAAKQIRVMKPKDQTSPRPFHTGKKGDTQRIIKFLQSHPPSRLHSYVAVERLKGSALKLVKEMKLAERPN
jgi:hypothetical protein